MPASAATVWEARTAGSINNGGGWVVGATGVDYSQQNSPQYALTGLTSAGAGNVVLSAAAAADMVGNFAKVVSGTNFTVGWFQITSVVVGVSFTCATNAAGTGICTGVGATGVINIGGAVGSLFDIFAEAEPGNLIYSRGGAYTQRGATDTTTKDGTLALPITVIGYNSSRGDLDTPSYNADGSLVTTNYPVIDYAQTFRLNAVGSDYAIWRNIKFTSAGTGASSPIFVVGVQCVVHQCYVSNPSTNAAAYAMLVNTNSVVENCDFAMTGASGGAACVQVTTAGARFIGNRFIDSQTVGIQCGAGATSTIILDNVAFAAVVGPVIDLTNTTTTAWIVTRGNTIQGKATAIRVAAVTYTALSYFGDNHLTDNTTGILSLQDGTSQLAGWFSHNRFRDNTTNVDGWDGWRAGGTVGEVTTDTGGASTDYTNVAADQYMLIDGAPGAGTSSVINRDIGALQQKRDLPATTNVRSGTTYGVNASRTGTLAVPAAGSVLNGVAVDNTTGTYVTVATANVRSGTTFGAGSALTGTLAVPAAGNVLNGVAVDNTTGTYVVVAVGNVRNGITFGAASAQTGTLVIPIENDVRDGVDYGASGTEFDGDLVLPAESNVKTGVQYGADGTEFTGTFSGGGGGGTNIPLGG